MGPKKAKDFIYSLFFIIVSAMLISGIWELLGRAKVAITESKQAQAKYEMLEDRRAKLQANLSELNTERGRDSAIRTAFGVARSGEEVIVLVPTEEATTTTEKSWWQKLVGWF